MSIPPVLDDAPEWMASPMRVPYVVGRWVRGKNHYGRQRLIDFLIQVDDSAIWVIGTRRMGKTSLLRQLEFITSSASSELVPLVWDLQGCQSCHDLSSELHFALGDVAERFVQFGVDVDALTGQDAALMLRRVGRDLNEQGKKLLLLIDEAEALIDIGREDPNGLARLRKSLQSGHFRTVMTSTKLLTQLHDLSAEWNTSPFLFGFHLANLWMLDREAAVALVRQSQSDMPVEVDEKTLDDVLSYTNAHPYLIQFLCQRLFQADSAGRGYLRPVRDMDLMPDHLLAGFFQIDFRHLSRLERRLLLTVSELTVASLADLLAVLSDEAPARISMFLYGLHRLGYLRTVADRWAVGNEFLRRWVQDNFAALSQDLDSLVDERNLEALLQTGHNRELEFLEHESQQSPQDLIDLRRHSLPGASNPALPPRT